MHIFSSNFEISTSTKCWIHSSFQDGTVSLKEKPHKLVFSSYGSIRFFLRFPVHRKKGKKTALQRRHHPWARASSIPARTRPSTKGSGSQGITNIPINEAGGGLAPAKIKKPQPNNKKSSFFKTHYYGTKRILMHFRRGIESPQYALCVSWQFKNASAPRPRGARTNLLPRDTKLISRV